MEATGYVRVVDHGEELEVGATDIVAVLGGRVFSFGDVPSVFEGG